MNLNDDTICLRVRLTRNYVISPCSALQKPSRLPRSPIKGIFWHARQEMVTATTRSSVQGTRGRSPECDANGTIWPAKPMMKHASNPASQSRKRSRTASALQPFDVSNEGQGLLNAGL
jgi:hypothetical protein